jgi:hypothetical protein
MARSTVQLWDAAIFLCGITPPSVHFPRQCDASLRTWLEKYSRHPPPYVVSDISDTSPIHSSSAQPCLHSSYPFPYHKPCPLITNTCYMLSRPRVYLAPVRSSGKPVGAKRQVVRTVQRPCIPTSSPQLLCLSCSTAEVCLFIYNIPLHVFTYNLGAIVLGVLVSVVTLVL